MADKDTSRKKKTIVLPILVCLLLVVLSGLFLLPTLLSTDWAGNKAKQVVNARIPGKFDFENLSLSWFKGIECQGLTYDNSAEGLQVKVAGITTSRGLLAFATNYRDIGEINIKEPVAYVYLKEKAIPEETDSKAPSGQQDSKISPKKPQVAGRSEVAEPDESRKPIKFPAIKGKFIITGGAVTAVSPDRKENPVLKDLELLLNVAGPENLLEYTIAFLSGDQTGKVKGAGSVTLPEEDILRLGKIQTQGTLDIEKWEITDFLSILATAGDMPTGSGLLSGHISISGSTDTTVQLKGNLVARRVKLQGGPFKSDTPSLERVEVEVDAEKTASTITLNRLTLSSPLAEGTASGVFGVDNRKELASQGIIDLAELFTQFPRTLNLKPGITVSNGKIDLNAKIGATDKVAFFDGTVRLDKLQGVAGKKKLAWDKPVTLEGRGEQGPDGISMENFSIQSSFLNAQGRGDINHMQVQLAADIGAGLQEIEKFIQLEGWKSSGKMDLDLQMDSKTEELRSVEGNIYIKNFALQKKDKVIAPHGVLKAKLATDLRLDAAMRPLEIIDAMFDYQSWLGNGGVTLNNLVLATEQTNVQVKDMGFKGVFDLDHLTTLLQALEVFAGDTRLAGRAKIDTQLSIKDDRLDLGEISLDTRDLLFQKGDQRFSENQIHLTVQSLMDLKKKSATFKQLDLKTKAGHITLPELVITDWSQLENSIKAIGSIDLDLGLFIMLLGDVFKVPLDTTVAGKAAIRLNVDLTEAKQQSVKLDGILEQVKISSNNKPLLSEESIRLVMDLKGNVHDKNFTLSKLDLVTIPVSVSASGKVVSDKNELLLTGEGSMALDLKAVSGYLKVFTDVDLEMSGATKRPFAIKTTTVDGKWVELPRHTELSTSFYAESIKGFGVHITSLEVPIRLDNSAAVFEVQGVVNRGKMALKPTIDFTVEPPLISIPENNTILTGVGLTEAMSNDLLAKVHPLFKGAAVSQGTVSLGLQNFTWPLGAAARKDAAFAGSLTFIDVKLKAGGLLAPLLEVMKVEEREITLGDQPMEFIGENDRIRCSPLEIKIKEYSLTLTGSIGFDQSLDYIAQVPVTRNMVSSDVYKYLEGTFISVPIGGTVSKPSVSRNVVQAALKDLIMQAGKKQITEQAGKLLQNLFK